MKIDLILKNARLVNVLSGEIEENATIAIAGQRIAGIGPKYEAENVVDLEGCYVYPALIDAHIHLESTKLTVREAARVLAGFGTGSVVTDPHEIANVCGMDGIDFQMQCGRTNGFINVYFTAPSCVPALKDPAIETFANDLGPDALKKLLDEHDVIALGEMMNVPGIMMHDPEVMQKIKDFIDHNRTIDGHAPMVLGQTLQRCIFEGVDSDHESTCADEALEKLRRGIHIMIREGSSERNLDALLHIVNEFNAANFSFASDDLDPTDLLSRGHINHLVSRAVKAGMNPVRALQLATINPARHFHLDRAVGAIRPGLFADLVVAPDLVSFIPKDVMHHGQFVIKNQQEVPQPEPPRPCLAPAMRVALPNVSELAIPNVPGKKAHALSLVPGQILTNDILFYPRVHDGFALPDPAQNIAKVCVFERHKTSGAFGKAFVHGFGMKHGAMGSSVGHDSHNIVVVGMNDADIMHVAQIIRDMNGGQAACLGDDVECLPLPIAGLMSDRTAKDVVDAEKRLDDFCAHALGVSLPRPMAALSFISLPVIPNIRITDQGLFRIDPGAYPVKIDVFD